MKYLKELNYNTLLKMIIRKEKKPNLKIEEGALFKSLDEMKVPDLSEEFRNSFINRLSQTTASNPIMMKERNFIRYLKVAAIAAIFVIGWFLGSINSSKDKALLQNLQSQLDKNNSLLVLTLLKQSSASDRLQATNVSYTLSNIDNQVYSALIASLENDPDPNVRIKCAEILVLHMNPDTLCKVFEKALDYQNDPFMQLLLINYISSINDPQSNKILINFSKSNKVDEFVRSEVKKTLNL
jgi:hypothetical protein